MQSDATRSAPRGRVVSGVRLLARMAGAEEAEPGTRTGEPDLGFEVPEADAWEQAIEEPIDEPPA